MFLGAILWDRVQTGARKSSLFVVLNSEHLYLGLQSSIDISLGKSCREKFVHAEIVCMNGNSFLDGEQEYLNHYYMTPNIF